MLLSGKVRRTLVLKLERNRQKDEFVSSLSPWTPTHGKGRWVDHVKTGLLPSKRIEK